MYRSLGTDSENYTNTITKVFEEFIINNEFMVITCHIVGVQENNNKYLNM